MSSKYSIICTTHTPALVASDDYTSHAEALHDAARRTPRGDGQHPNCDLVVARSSGSWVTLACPGRGIGGNHSRCQSCHGPNLDEWTEVEWIRLAYAAMNSGIELKLRSHYPHCWTPGRIASLGPFLALEEQ